MPYTGTQNLESGDGDWPIDEIANRLAVKLLGWKPT
jgi:hypothetical protein